MKLRDEEEQALSDAALLMKYAAESPKTLPDSIVAPIANAWKAREENAWSPDVSTKFWIAYSGLCDLLKPVTLDTIAAKTPIKSRRWFFFGDFKDVTLPHRTAHRYLLLLIVLLLTAVVFGFIVTTTKQMSDEIKDLIARGNTAALESLRQWRASRRTWIRWRRAAITHSSCRLTIPESERTRDRG